MSTIAPVIDANGIQVPPFEDVLAFLQGKYREIYGADVYLENDSQDGQFLGIIATAINDLNAAIVAAYNSFSPATAQGNGLSSVVKINGISRATPSNSQVNVKLVGQAGTTVNDGAVTDANGFRWLLPAVVTIPPAGEITVTATCTKAGAVPAAAGTVNQIATPTLGWQTVTNDDPASMGAPIESDAALRRRQETSVALPSKTVLSSILGAVQSLGGVTAAVIYENDTDTTDALGLPEHSIAVVAQGGDSSEIAQAIMRKKTPGTATYGTTTVDAIDDVGLTHAIKYSVPVDVRTVVKVQLKPLPGYTTQVAADLKAAVASYINALGIGQAVYRTRLFMPAQLNGGTGSTTFELVDVLIAEHPAAPAAADVAIAFNELASCQVSDIVIEIVP